MNRSKVLIGWFLIILMAFIGLVIGTAIGSFFVLGGSGMTGSATALVYGFVGLLLALVAGSLYDEETAFRDTKSCTIYNSNRCFIGVWFYNLSNNCIVTK